jgi:hypothetical protein
MARHRTSGGASIRGGVVALAQAAKVTTDAERFGCGDDSGYGGELVPDELCEQWALGRCARLRERRLAVVPSLGRSTDVPLRTTPARRATPRSCAAMRRALTGWLPCASCACSRDELWWFGAGPSEETLADPARADARPGGPGRRGSSTRRIHTG